MKIFHVGGMNLMNRYKTLDAAVARAKDDDTIELHKDIVFSGVIPSNIILNGNGHTIKVENGTVGLDCQNSVVLQNITFISSPRSNAVILRKGGRMEQVITKIEGPARVLYPTIILKEKSLLLNDCDIMRLSTEYGTSVTALKTKFRDYYGAVFHIGKALNASVFSGEATLKNCELDCCYFKDVAHLYGCTIRNFNRSCGQISVHGSSIMPAVTTPVVNLKKEPIDGPLEYKNENTHYAWEQEGGLLQIEGYQSKIPEEFVGFHILYGSVEFRNVSNNDENGYHMMRNASISFTDCTDHAYFDLENCSLSTVRSQVNTSIQQKTALEKLQELIGLGTVKAKLQSLINTIARNKQGNDKNFGFSYHMVFAGDPGTGKTTVAKIVAQALFEIGIIPENKCTEVAASSLVKGYVGQTAAHVEEVLKNALGGVLFIDEAYELTVRDGTFNSDVLSVLLRYMEEYRDKLVVIAAGYEQEMRAFLASNIGLTRRFQWVSFPDYTVDEMAEIFELVRTSYGEVYEVEELGQIIPPLFENLTALYRKKPDMFGRTTNGGNAGLVRNVFQQIILAKNDRLTVNSDTYDVITEADIKQGFREEMQKAVHV